MRYIYCHPLFDEMKCAYRFSYQLKKTFEANGLLLERFDYRGTGEAQGDFKDVSLETLRDDLSGHINGQQVTLIGVRFGASLAFDYCVGKSQQVKNLVLLEPIVDGAEYADYLYRKQQIKDMMSYNSSGGLKNDGFKNLEGYKTSLKFIEQIKRFNLFKTAGKYTANNFIFIGQISGTSKVNPQVKNWAKLLVQKAKHISIENIDLPIFWERIPCFDYSKLTQKVSGWCYG